MSPTHLIKLTRTLVLLVCAVSVTCPPVLAAAQSRIALESPWNSSNERESDGEDGGEGSSGAEARPIYASDRRSGRLDRQFGDATVVWHLPTMSDDGRVTGRLVIGTAVAAEQRSPLLRC